MISRQAAADDVDLEPDPKSAKVAQLTFYVDYQDVWSSLIQRQLNEVQSTFGKFVSLKVRQFPNCRDCNLFARSSDNQDSCRAAFTAHAALALRGAEGFNAIHSWLLEKRGEFSDEELRRKLLLIGLEGTEVQEFFQAIESRSIRHAVLSDVTEAGTRNVRVSPAVYLDGRRLSTKRNRSIFNAVENLLEKPRSSVSKDQVSLNSGILTERLQADSLQSTVRIVNSGLQTTGSGVIFAHRGTMVYVLTAAHLLIGENGIVVQVIPDKAGESLRNFQYITVVARSEAQDLAVIRFSTHESVPSPMRLVAPGEIPLNGNLESEPIPAATTGFDAKQLQPSCLATRVTGSKRIRRKDQTYALRVWEIENESSHGRSGGPLISSLGAVIGIASGVNDGRGYFVHAKEIHRFLELHGLDRLLIES